ncbi:RING finger protein 32 isoform X2 [Engraulis encrasicolus]|uniref:RING finger protein 32 isoform X2 n=1 Tax=Engraulis encrasicolus TaxID=184585 RepID=UPI002FD282E5
MRKCNISKSDHGSNMALTAVAFQDHIARTLMHSLSIRDPVREKNLRGGRGRGRGQRQCQRNRHTGGDSRPAQQTQCHHQHQAQRSSEGREYVLDPAPPPLTLAQRMGLVEAPERRLSETEWEQVKRRSVQEGDSSQPCVICREQFRLQPQVLLSCTHVFHKACLKAFERYSGRKCCPMCRREQYETRVIHEGARIYRHQCIVRIQAWWRGCMARRWYRDVRRTVPPKDKRLRQQFFENKLQEMSDSLVQACHTDTEAFLNAIESSVAQSRLVFQEMEETTTSAAAAADPTAADATPPRPQDWEQIQEQMGLNG